MRVFGFLAGLAIQCAAMESADAQESVLDLSRYDPMSFVAVDYTYARFDGGDAGDGTTLSIAASRTVLEADWQPTFLAIWNHFGSADDELALANFGGQKVGLRQRWLRAGVMAGIDLSHEWFENAPERHRRVYALLGLEYNDIQLSLHGLEVDRDTDGILAGGGLRSSTPRGICSISAPSGSSTRTRPRASTPIRFAMTI